MGDYESENPEVLNEINDEFISYYVNINCRKNIN